MSIAKVLGQHAGIRYGMDDGWSCVCERPLDTSGATPETRQAKVEEARIQWAHHVSAAIARDLLG